MRQPVTEQIVLDFQGSATRLGDAGRLAANAAVQAERVQARSGRTGFRGIAHGMARTVVMLKRICAQLATLGQSVQKTVAAIRETADAPNPEQVKAKLAAAANDDSSPLLTEPNRPSSRPPVISTALSGRSLKQRTRLARLEPQLRGELALLRRRRLDRQRVAAEFVERSQVQTQQRPRLARRRLGQTRRFHQRSTRSVSLKGLRVHGRFSAGRPGTTREWLGAGTSMSYRKP